MVYLTLLLLLYVQVVPDREVPGGTLPGLGTEAIPIAIKYAAVTAIPLSLLFLWADRYRPQRFWVWFMTFGWGACVATFISAQINSWAAGHLSIIGNGDPATAARAAIYVAPFVEEASKATVLFWLAILMRYQWVSRLSGIVLAGLSGAAFAFTENILYYGRVYRYAARTFGEVPPLEALQSLFVMRGLLTFFGHPLFTAMTGIGLAIALRSKSKVVRVVAPLAGYCVAVFLHMAFNTTATLDAGQQPAVHLPCRGTSAGRRDDRLRRAAAVPRRPADPRAARATMSGWAGCPKAIPRRCLGCVRGSGRSGTPSSKVQSTFLATIRLQRAVTELAYLRDALTRGLIDEAGRVREKELLAKIRAIRPEAVVLPEGRAAYPSFRRRRTGVLDAYAPPSYPGPAGLGGNYPAPNAFPAPLGQPQGASAAAWAPLGQTATQYSEVDPSWKPPGRVGSRR